MTDCSCLRRTSTLLRFPKLLCPQLADEKRYHTPTATAFFSGTRYLPRLRGCSYLFDKTYVDGDIMEVSSVRLRQAVSRDVDPVVRLVNAGGPEGKPRNELPAVLPPAYMRAFEVINADANHLLMVAELDGTIIGTFQITFLTYLAGAGQTDAQIEAVHVAAKHRGQGIGTMMLVLPASRVRSMCRLLTRPAERSW